MNAVYWKYNKDLREKRVELEVKLRQTVSHTKKGEKDKKDREGAVEGGRVRKRERKGKREKRRKRERERKSKQGYMVCLTHKQHMLQ